MKYNFINKSFMFFCCAYLMFLFSSSHAFSRSSENLSFDSVYVLEQDELRDALDALTEDLPFLGVVVSDLPQYEHLSAREKLEMLLEVVRLLEKEGWLLAQEDYGRAPAPEVSHDSEPPGSDSGDPASENLDKLLSSGCSEANKKCIEDRGNSVLKEDGGNETEGHIKVLGLVEVIIKTKKEPSCSHTCDFSPPEEKTPQLDSDELDDVIRELRSERRRIDVSP